jgi:competence protein ComEA
MSTRGPNDSRPPRLLLRRADQAGIAALVLFALVMIGGYWFTQAVLRRRVIDIEGADPRTAAFQVDINSADWPELAQIPGLGETLARRIVQWRAAHGPFKEVAELRGISGIGPKKFEAIRPYLRPLGKDLPAADR